MKITVLGSGSAFGVPMLFNTWKGVNPTNPKNERTRASLLLEENDCSILIDAGPELRIQTNRFNVKNIDAVLITHAHYDHIGGIPELPRATKILEHGIDIYATKETMAGIKDNYGYLFKEKADAEPDSKSLRWALLPECGNFNVAGLNFETLTFAHHKIFSSGFRYKNFAYVTDWQALPEGSDKFFSNLDLLIIECNNGNVPEENGHADLFKIKEIKEKFNPKHIVLSHLSWRIDYDSFAKLLPPDCELSYDGMVLNYK